MRDRGVLLSPRFLTCSFYHSTSYKASFPVNSSPGLKSIEYFREAYKPWKEDIRNYATNLGECQNNLFGRYYLPRVSDVCEVDVTETNRLCDSN